MDAIAVSKEFNSQAPDNPLQLSDILPPTYSDILVEKCLKYYRKVFGQKASEELTEILKCASQNTPPKNKTFHYANYNNHIYIGELDFKGKISNIYNLPLIILLISLEISYI